MKKFFAVLFVLILFVLGALGADLSPRSSAKGEQKFSSLPIGYNLDEYISSIEIWIGPYDPNGPNGWNDAFRVLIDPKVGGSATINARFPYSHAHDGRLTEFATLRIREIVGKIPAVLGDGRFLWGWSMDAITDGIGGLLPYYGESKPATIATADSHSSFSLVFRNGKWEVPEEVFGKVKFGWGIAVPFHIPTLWNLRVTLYDNQGRVSRFSAQERIADSDNPCELPSVLGGLSVNDAYIPREVALANNAWWTSAEVELLTLNNEQSVTFLVNRTEQDGKAIRWSNPPPSFFTPPTPKIASLTRVRHTTEITVSADSSTTVHLEFSESLGGNWYSIPKYLQPLSLETGSTKFTHATEALQCFYRLRLAEPQLQR